ncbi:uncharacterized protein [Antedon mediterranea]|uniref:uncharacterized protein n=1 Tax=Antedon mediterranea TaxID=105859 RepID=UPI003AF9EC48
MATALIVIAICGAVFGPSVVLSQSILHFQEEPVSTNVYDGQTVTLRCVLQSSWTTGVVHWVKDELTEISRGSSILTHPLIDYTRFSIVGDRSQGNNNLQIKNVKSSDAGLFVCHLYDSQGYHQAETGSALLKVLPIKPPLPGYPLCPISIPNPGVGDTIILRCYSVGEQPPAILTFWRGQHEEMQVERYIGSYGGVFFERQLNEDDNNSTFTCMAKGPAFKPENHKNCSVIPFFTPTSVNVSPAIAEVPTGMTATFHCKTRAIPQVTKYRWWIWNNGWEKIIRTGGRYAIDGDGESIRILDINKYDNGRKVRCIARNSLGLKGEAEGKLRVYVVRPTARGPNWSGGQPGNNGNNRLYNSTNPTDSYKDDDGIKIGTGPNVILIVGCVVAGFFGIIVIACLVVILIRKDSRNKHRLVHLSTASHPDRINKEGISINDTVDKSSNKLVGYATIDSATTNVPKTSQHCRFTKPGHNTLYAKPVLRTESNTHDLPSNIITTIEKNNVTTKRHIVDPEAILVMYAKPIKGKDDKTNTLGDRPVPSPRKNSIKSSTFPKKQPLVNRPNIDTLHCKPTNNKIYENDLLKQERDETSIIEEARSEQTTNNVEGLVYAELNLQEAPVHFVRIMRSTEYAKIKSNNHNF